MKNQGNIQPSEQNIPLVTGFNEMDIYELSYKEFKIIVFNKLTEFLENTDKQLKEIRKMKVLTKTKNQTGAEEYSNNGKFQ